MKSFKKAGPVLLVAMLTCSLLLGGGCSKWWNRELPPFYKWLDAGFKFDGNMNNCGGIRLRSVAIHTDYVRGGRFGRACHFSGDGTLTINDMPIPDQGTWALWFRIAPDADVTQEIRIVDANHCRIALVDGKLELRFHDGAWRRYATADRMPKGQWVHAAMTWSRDKVLFYVNGALAGATDYAGKPTERMRKVIVGARWTGSDNWFTGDVDELLMYGRALAAEELAALVASGLDKARPPEFISSTKEVVMESPVGETSSGPSPEDERGQTIGTNDAVTSEEAMEPDPGSIDE